MNEQISEKIGIDEDIMALSRRNFLKNLSYGSMLVLSGCGVGNVALRHLERQNIGQQKQSGYLHSPEHKSLSFEHTHTGEKLKITYFESGNYIKDALHEINFLLRDFRTNDIHPIDTTLLDQLFNIKQTLYLNKPFHIISGYRSPYTNSQLRKNSHRVADHSLHLQGRAIDIRVEGVSSKTIRNTAQAMEQGGVGYYPRDNFVHLDTGDFRAW